ncbi:hypothetical protein [Streptomyces griseiscabiei]|uniref:Uncharacterized protein n=1 Tax=Streptomyces griseiscabiei TaxID=2993540 RepID=A0ABU4LJ57_9ACTN|nr:hypothetical protein [Streptomyces griseiscabiei]MBZ3908078.1 hypothetical protein [Streptomyces griseiscabiei]MDX2915496.1 hypothetical protein [Streptomyces griseiscabiei]
MTHPIPRSGRRLWGRIALALTGASVLTLTGLPGLPRDAEAAPKAGVRCDELYLKQRFARTPANSGPPSGSTPYDAAPNDENYTFDNPDKAFDGLKSPTEAQLKQAGSSTKAIAKWKAAYAASGKPADRAMEIYARYNAQRNKATGYKDFGDYLRIRIIGNTGNRVKGETFEARMVKKYNMVGPDWWCQDPIPYKDPKTGKTRYRIVDFRDRVGDRNIEGKSNGSIRNNQYEADRIIARDPKYAKTTFHTITGAKTTQGTIDKIKAFDDELKQTRGTSRTQAGIWEQRSNGIERTGKPNVYTNYDKRFNADPLKGGRGPIIDEALRSGKTPEEAKRLQKMYDANNAKGYFGRPGGIDFSSLEMNFVGEPVKGKGLDYSMKADFVPDPENNPGWGGDAKLTMASDSLFTWLALTPDKFWVNLNPDQPSTIMDSQFASTDAGRVLLEADLKLKHDFFKALDPKTETGKRAWDGMAERDGWPCLHSLRNWIEPDTAQVREQDGGIYILDAPLKLQTEPMDISTPGPGGEGCDLTKAETEQNDRVLKNTIVPLVEKWINTGSDYADLRRVYTSRVAAEWIRQKDRQSATDYRKIINSDDVSRWPLRAPNQNWKKTDVYDRYVKIFKEGEFKYEISNGQDVYVYTVGGVDFSKSPKRNVTRVQFDLEHPGLDRTTRTSVQAVTTYRDTDTVFLGGNSNGTQPAPGDEDPAPEPTPSGPGRPTPSDPPSTPAPDPSPSTPGGGDPQSPPGNRPDPDGGLADTGSGLPVGLLSGIAAAVVAAGGALVWWMRRRRTAES